MDHPGRRDHLVPQGREHPERARHARPGRGAQTYYYTNQQSSRLLFYHDHSWGITRLNVYAGEVAGYLIRDKVEQDLIDRRVIPTRERSP